MNTEDVKQLQSLKNYFAENDKTPFHHKAFSDLDRMIKKETEIAQIKEGELLPEWAERQVLDDYIDWYNNHIDGGSPIITIELIDKFLSAKTD